MKSLTTLMLTSILALSACAGNNSPSPDSRYKIVAGILTQDPTTHQWYLTNDAGHATENIASVRTEDNAVVIAYTFQSKRVVSFIASPDASYAVKGFEFGGQIGNQAARIWYGAPDSGGVFHQVTTDQAYVQDSNIMIYGVFDMGEQ